MDYDTKAGCARIQILVDKEIARLSRHIYVTSNFLEKLALINSKPYIEDHTGLLDNTPTMRAYLKSAKCISTDKQREEDENINRMEIYNEGNSKKCEGTSSIQEVVLNEEISKSPNDETSLVSLVTLKNVASGNIPVYSFELQEHESARSEEVSSTTTDHLTSLESSGFVEGNSSYSSTNHNFDYLSDGSQMAKNLIIPDQLNSIGRKELEDSGQPTSDNYQDYLGLFEESFRKEFSKEQMEQKFAALVLAWTIDRKIVDDRYHKQSLLLREYKEEVKKKIGKTINTLQPHNKYDETTAGDAVKQLDQVMQCLEKILCMAEECGGLRYEMRNIRYWNLVTNYVASLRQEIDRQEIDRPKKLPLTKSEACEKCKNGIPDFNAELLLKERKHSKPRQLQVTIIGAEYTTFDDVNYGSSISSGNKLKKLLMTVLILTVCILGFILYVQWQCSRSTLKAPQCPLDYIFRYRRGRFGISPL